MADVIKKLNVKNSRKVKHFIDVNGTHFSVSSSKNNSVRFTLYHSKIDEGISRKEYEYMSVIIEQTDAFFTNFGELHSRIGGSFISSNDPIRDKGNAIILEADPHNSCYLLTFCRDLSNELNLPSETSVAMNDQPFVEFFDEIATSKENGIQYQLKLTH